MSISIKALPISERPYEKLEMYGEGSLTNSELLAIIIKNGTKEENSLQLAHKILTLKDDKETNSLRFLQDITLEEYLQIKGIGKVKAMQLIAVCELAKRMSKPINKFDLIIKSPKDVANLVMQELRFEKREIIKVLMLNSRNVVIRSINISYGGTRQVSIAPKDIYYEAIKLGAPKIILVHNHPSGDGNPSKNDITFTKQVLEAGKILGIELLDHIVIGDGDYKSILSIPEI